MCGSIPENMVNWGTTYTSITSSSISVY